MPDFIAVFYKEKYLCRTTFKHIIEDMHSMFGIEKFFCYLLGLSKIIQITVIYGCCKKFVLMTIYFELKIYEHVKTTRVVN